MTSPRPDSSDRLPSTSSESAEKPSSGTLGLEPIAVKGAMFLTEPKDHGIEIRSYIQDPDGNPIEVGQLTRTPS